jgi:hypothetical protein
MLRSVLSGVVAAFAFCGAAPSPVPTAAPVVRGFAVSAAGSATFIGQQTGGPGTQPPEGPAFINGSPLSPNTPYDLWSSAPLTPGYAGITQTTVTGEYTGTQLHGGATVGFGIVDGSVTNAAYWGENLLPSLNPHLGSSALPYRVIFPSRAGEDDANAWRLDVLGVNVGENDGSWALRAGYFDPRQSLNFVFVQPPLTNVTPNMGLAPPESLGNGPPKISVWPTPEPGLPLDGIDATARIGSTSLEFSDALLPALAETAAHLRLASAVLQGADDSSLTIELSNMNTTGALISTTTYYGYNARIVSGPQGLLPISTLGNQHETILGISGSFMAAPGLDATLEAGRSWYDAADVIRPGTQAPGGYYHVRLSHALGSATVEIEGYRFEPRYATAILPYGVPENIWSTAFAWPGVWLKSTYQLVDNSVMGANREGWRIQVFSRDSAPVEVRASFMSNRQVVPATFANMMQTGFVDGFFLPQPDSAATIGTGMQYAAWIGWHCGFGTLSFDYVNDLQHRPALPGHAVDYAGYVAPQAVLAYSRRISNATLISAGVGRWAMRGTWATLPLDYGQTTIFAGVQFVQSAHFALLIDARHATFEGLPSLPLGPSPDLGSNLIVVEEHYLL